MRAHHQDGDGSNCGCHRRYRDIRCAWSKGAAAAARVLCSSELACVPGAFHSSSRSLANKASMHDHGMPCVESGARLAAACTRRCLTPCCMRLPGICPGPGRTASRRPAPDLRRVCAMHGLMLPHAAPAGALRAARQPALLRQSSRAAAAPAARRGRRRGVIVASLDYIATASDEGVLKLPARTELDAEEIKGVFGYPR